MACCGFPSVGGGSIGVDRFSQRINAGAFLPDTANTQSSLVSLPYGTSPGADYVIYPTIDFPAVWQDSSQYWYVETSPPVGWTSGKLKFRVHFIVRQSIVLPGGYRFVLGARKNGDQVTPFGSKTYVNLDYILSTTTQPLKRVTSISGELTLSGALDSDGLALELSRGVEPISDESDSAYVIGIDLFFV